MKTIIWILGIGAAIMIASNWTKCGTGGGQVFDANGRAITDVNGNFLVNPNPCGATLACHTVATSQARALSCLLNPFPGGL